MQIYKYLFSSQGWKREHIGSPLGIVVLTSGFTALEVIGIKIFKGKNRSLFEHVSLEHYDKIMNI